MKKKSPYGPLWCQKHMHNMHNSILINPINSHESYCTLLNFIYLQYNILYKWYCISQHRVTHAFKGNLHGNILCIWKFIVFFLDKISNRFPFHWTHKCTSKWLSFKINLLSFHSIFIFHILLAQLCCVDKQLNLFPTSLNHNFISLCY